MFSANTSQVSADQLFVEDVFSTYLYTGNGSTQTITNGIDLAGKGGLVWIKNRGIAQSHILTDTARGTSKFIASNLTNAEINPGAVSVTSFNSNGFGMTWGSGFGANVNDNASNYASWTFREAPKFFDVVTYTGNGSTQSISHNLGTAPGTIIVKSYGAGGSWIVYHQSLGAGSRLFLNATNAATTTVPETVWGNNTTTVAPTSTAFTTGSALNVNGDTYVAYLFAHDTTSDGIIQCGSFTTDGSGNATVNLGWEPQWVMVKTSSTAGDWITLDTMRGWTVSGVGNMLKPNTSDAEANLGPSGGPNATGFAINGIWVNTTLVYIAIRRGPMRTPTSGTSVFWPFAVAGNSATRTLNAGFPTDLYMCKQRDNVYNTNSFLTYDRLRGKDALIETNLTAAEQSFGLGVNFDNNDGVVLTGGSGYTNASGATYLHYLFRRAPSFFDEVCYTGDGGAYNPRPHNLGVTPELIINKNRGSTGSWWVKCSAGSGSTLRLETTGANLGSPGSLGTTTTFNPAVSDGTQTYVAYLFATCPGVSKVGSYTGNGSSQTINCGFAAGARFVMIKRTDSTGDWWVWDTARGLTSANDPALRFNSTATDTTGIDSVDPDSSGFIVNQDATTNINVSSANYIYLAVA